MSKITLGIIAEATGLSKYAVSRALSGKSGVSEETRSRVIKVAESMGYRRTEPVRQHQISAVFDESDVVNSESNMLKQKGAQIEAERLGYSIKAYWISSPDDIDKVIRESAGMLLIGSVHDPESIRRAHASKVPVVRIGRLFPMEQVDAALGTDREGATAMGRHLLDLGHREIAYVRADATLSGRVERMNGLREALDEVPDSILHDLVWDNESSFSDVANALLSTGARPTAWFCAHDCLALTVLSDLQARGIQIPHDASVVGFGDSAAVRKLRPRLSTIHVFGTEQGAAAMNLLDRRIRHPKECPFPIRMIIPAELVIRDSSGPAPKRRS